jgi:hypothetical protein
MTFLELCQRLRQEVGAAGTGPAAVSGQNGEYARLIGWVQQAWNEIQLERRRWRFSWAEASIDVEPPFREFSPPADLDDWDADTLRIGSNPLRALAWSDFREMYRDDSGQQRPSTITITPDGNFRLDTSPEAIGRLTFEYWRTPQALVNGGDEPRLHERYHMVIIYRAMLFYALYESAPEVATRAQQGEGELMRAMGSRELGRIQLGGPLA